MVSMPSFTKIPSIEIADISGLEDRLGKMLSLRQANPEFVQNLKHRLMYDPGVQVEARKKYTAIWILAAALFSGGFIVFILSLLFGRGGKS